MYHFPPSLKKSTKEKSRACPPKRFAAEDAEGKQTKLRNIVTDNQQSHFRKRCKK